MNEDISFKKPLSKLQDLSHLKEGEIFVDENGKRYRVRKTMLPQSATSGPHGQGDPNDRTLRLIESDIIIPNRMNREIEKVECHEQYMGLVNCMRAEGDVKGLANCKKLLKTFNVCKKAKFEDLSFRQKITDDYINIRSEIRRTGKPPSLQNLDKFREWRNNQTFE